MNVPVGSELFAKSTVDRRGMMRIDGRKWPQRPDELRRLGEIIVSENVHSYLEIGLLNGFTLRYLGGLLPPRSRIVGVDLVDEFHLNQRTVDLHVTADALHARGYDVDIIIGDSTIPEIVDQVRQLGPFDFVLIDGDHTMRVAHSDWVHYGAMGRIVAFHDIDADRHPSRTPAARRTVEVQKLWRELKPQYRHVELIGKAKGAGIGVLWRS